MFHPRRVIKIGERSDGIVSCPRRVGDCSYRQGQDEGKSKGKGELAVSFSGRGRGKW